MSSTRDPASDIAFTPTVKAVQARKGSRDAYAQLEQGRGWRRDLTPELTAFVQRQTSVFLATCNADGQPYVQHRGGPPGFLRVVGPRSIAFADFSGNRQYITQGNLLDNDKAFLFLMDYRLRRRVKLWGTARVDEDARRADALMPAQYDARAEQTILFEVRAWDINCPQHIPLRFEAEEVAQLLAERDARIAELEQKLARLEGDPRGG